MSLQSVKLLSLVHWHSTFHCLSGALNSLAASRFQSREPHTAGSFVAFWLIFQGQQTLVFVNGYVNTETDKRKYRLSSLIRKKVSFYLFDWLIFFSFVIGSRILMGFTKNICFTQQNSSSLRQCSSLKLHLPICFMIPVVFLTVTTLSLRTTSNFLCSSVSCQKLYKLATLLPLSLQSSCNFFS